MSLSKTLFPLLSTGSTEKDHVRADPEFFQRGPNFDNVIFLFFF